MTKSFYNLVVSMASSRLSFAFFSMTFIIILYGQTGSATLASAVTLITTLAQITCGMLLPGLTRIYSSKFILYFSQISQLLIFILLIVLFNLNLSTFTISLLFILNFLLGLMYAATSPIKNAVVPTLIHKDYLVKANTVLATSDQTLLLIGWALGGILISILGDTILLMISFALLVVSLISLKFVNFQPVNNTPLKKTKKYAVFMESWTMLFTHPKVRAVTFMDIIYGFGGTVWIGAVTLAFVTEVYDLGEAWWGYINAAYFTGTILGGFIIWRIAKHVQSNFIKSILISSLCLGILTFSYGIVHIPYIGLLLVVLMGPFFQLMSISIRSYLQHEIAKEELPSVFASRATLNQIIFSFSIFLIGMIVDLFGPQVAYLFAGGLFLLSTFIGSVFFRQIRNSSKDVNLQKTDIHS
ncbi:MAG: MFS transporter [Bacillaceae bacterium]|nr:MFS transporter [Bacillaceae bacterium]